MSRPWWVAGLTLALMETLADFGTVSIFNFDTFTTAIYKAWFSMFNLPLASQLASLLVFLVLGLAWAEQRARGQRAYAGRLGVGERIVLFKGWRWLACAVCGLVWLMAFAVPIVQVVVWVASVWRQDLDARYGSFVWHSMLLAGLSALVVVSAALWLAFVRRLRRDAITRGLTQVATMGYAVPGMVLAVGVYIPVAWLDKQIAALAAGLGLALPWLLGGTILVMLLGLVSRFLAVGFGPLDAGMKRITLSQEEAARTLGLSPQAMLRRLHLPLLSGSVLSAALLVFVDVMKEIPITLMTRPFGWDTLAVRVFEMTSEGMWERAALPALCIVLVGLLPVIFLTRES
jgi:iron(III) transport system permease protein